jgi:hypothetical protein
MTLLRMPGTGEMVEQGSDKDRATWIQCGACDFRGPHVGYNEAGEPRCMGSCGGVKLNEAVPRIPKS